MLLTTAMLFADRSLARAAVRPSSNQLCRKDYGGSGINIPLTKHTKNDGKTDLQWYAKISVGTPPQELNVLIDTGSPALLLPAGNCTTCGQQTLFDFDKSSTFSWTQTPFQDIMFGTSGDTTPVSGPVKASCAEVSDSVSVQGLTATEFRFILCDQQDAAFRAQGEIDGILGLPVEDSEYKGLEWSLYDAGLLASPLFGIYIPPGQITGGQLTLGLDDTKHDGTVTYVDLDNELSLLKQTWVMDLETVYVNGEKLQITTNTSTTRIAYPRALSVLDTGTAFISAPSYEVARDLYARISPKIYRIDPVGTWGAPCKDMETLTSNVTFLFGYDGGSQANVTLPAKSLNLGPYPGKEGICQAAINDIKQTNKDGRGVWVIGSPLLKQYYTTWNGRDLQVGFAPLKAPPASEVHQNGSKGKTVRIPLIYASVLLGLLSLL